MIAWRSAVCSTWAARWGQCSRARAATQVQPFAAEGAGLPAAVHHAHHQGTTNAPPACLAGLACPACPSYFAHPAYPPVARTPRSASLCVRVGRCVRASSVSATPMCRRRRASRPGSSSPSRTTSDGKRANPQACRCVAFRNCGSPLRDAELARCTCLGPHTHDPHSPAALGCSVQLLAPARSHSSLQRRLPASARTGKWRIKYYKGLGTSTSKEAREYFSDLKTHAIKFRQSVGGLRLHRYLPCARACVHPRIPTLPCSVAASIKRATNTGLTWPVFT